MQEYPDIAELTERQRVFCERYCVHWNATRAALESGYNDRSAHNMGFQNVRNNEKTKKYIAWIKAHALENSGVSLLRQLQELAKVAYASPSDVRNGWDTLKDWDSLSDEAKGAISEITTHMRVIKTVADDGERRVVQGVERITVKYHDKVKALMEINRIIGAHAPEKVSISTPASEPILIEIIPSGQPPITSEDQIPE